MWDIGRNCEGSYMWDFVTWVARYNFRKILGNVKFVVVNNFKF